MRHRAPTTYRAPMTRRTRAAVAVGAVGAAMAMAAGTAACSSTGGGPAANPGSSTAPAAPPGSGVKLTEEQRVTLSRLLQRNYDAQGGELTVTLPGGTARMDAQVDWVRGIGHATVDNAGTTSEFTWTSDEVVDGTITGLADAMAAAGHPGVRFVARPLDPTYSVLDQIAAVVLSLASETRDNPVALADQDIGYLGRRTLDGREVDTYRFGQRTTYLVDPATGTLVGVDALLASVEGLVEVRVKSTGTQIVRGPRSVEVIAGAEVPDLYRQLTGKPLPQVTSTTSMSRQPA